jgi:alkyl sulfatase BDS1-like metallo-beta-lactamase superfamily hydrolase
VTKEAFTALFLAERTSAELTAAGVLEADPDASALERLLGLLETFDLWFNIIEP